MLALAICGVIAVVALVLFLFVGIPFMLVLGLAPWALGVVGVILVVRALFQQPVALANFYPAALALIASAVLRWIL